MDTVNIKINGTSYDVPKGSTILEACRAVGIEIPTLCFLKEINEIGACRICVVEVKGARSLVASCVYPVNEGMEVSTHSPMVLKSRKTTVELMLSNHERNCLSCPRSTNCELQKLAVDLGVWENTFTGTKTPSEVDESAPHMIRNNAKCILCRRCVAVCDKYQSVAVIGTNDRGFNTHVGCAFDQDLNDVACVSCGQCVAVCPTGALVEKDSTEPVWEALADEKKKVFVHTAPAVRATLGECFGLPVGTNVEGKMVAALRRLGFDGVYDTNIGADMTIMEEANEFIERVQNGGTLPMITSCSPGWIKFCEHNYPDMIENLSSCKSPQQMTGAILKTYYAEKMGLDPKDIFVVSVMPCTAKKFEIRREEQSAAGVYDTDASITTRELAKMIEKAAIKFKDLPDEKFDEPFGVSTGAAVIFGATGGVMEAALRTAVETLTGEQLGSLDFKEVRGTQAIKEASYDVAGTTVKVAVTSGLANARTLLEKVKNGEADYHFIEIMGCPGGCVNGGGQPIQSGNVRNFTDLKGLRAKALYDQDAGSVLRKSHESPVVKTLYQDYFEKPGSHKAHELLHTSYVARKKF